MVAGPPLLNGRCTSLLRVVVSKMTYTVSSGTLNSNILVVLIFSDWQNDCKLQENSESSWSCCHIPLHCRSGSSKRTRLQTTKLGRTEWKIHGLRSLHRDILLLSLSMLAIVMVKSFSVLRPTRAESFALLHTAAADTDGLHCTWAPHVAVDMSLRREFSRRFQSARHQFHAVFIVDLSSTLLDC